MAKVDSVTPGNKIPTANLRASKRFSKYNRDLVAALLKEGSYTLAEAEQILDKFMAGKQPAKTAEVK